MKIRIHNLIDQSVVNGPGERTVVWLKGCTLACAGCWNQETHALDGGTLWDVAEFAEHLLRIRDQSAGLVEGITFSGGEPLHQVMSLTKLCAYLRKEVPEYSVGMYSGYTEQELNNGRYDAFLPTGVFRPHDRGQPQGEYWKLRAWYELQRHLDFVVHGRYNQLQPSKAPMRSSTNQVLKLYTDRYREEDFPKQAAEIHIVDGLQTITGFPTPELLGK